jgi:hypothetical protein
MKCIVNEWSTISLIINKSVCQYAPLHVKIPSGEWNSFSASQQFCQLLSYSEVNGRASKSLALLSIFESIHTFVSNCLIYVLILSYRLHIGLYVVMFLIVNINKEESNKLHRYCKKTHRSPVCEFY